MIGKISVFIKKDGDLALWPKVYKMFIIEFQKTYCISGFAVV
jgi:hypothetical protein